MNENDVTMTEQVVETENGACATESCEMEIMSCDGTTETDESVREQIRQKLNDIVDREVKERTQSTPTLDDDALIRELLSRPELLRRLAKAKSRAQRRTVAYPKFATGGMGAPATVYPEPKTIKEASEAFRHALGL